MTGYQSKKAAANAKLTVDRAQLEQWMEALKDIDALHHSQEPESVDAQKAIADMGQVLDEDDDTQVYGDALTIAYQSGFFEGKKAAQRVQEPVAWMWDVNNGGGYTTRNVGLYKTDIPFAKHTPLYTAPPQPTWVDLTDEQIFALFDSHNVYGSKWLEFARAVLAKSKEKNA